MGQLHRASIEPEALGELVRQIREIEVAVGDGFKRPGESEWKNRDVARRSLVASRAITAGEPFTEHNVTCKRPGTGVTAAAWFATIGKRAPRDFDPDELIEI